MANPVTYRVQVLTRETTVAFQNFPNHYICVPLTSDLEKQKSGALINKERAQSVDVGFENSPK